jgi:hypothetical protein
MIKRKTKNEKNNKTKTKKRIRTKQKTKKRIKQKPTNSFHTISRVCH